MNRVLREPPPGQAIGDLMAMALDGSRIEVIGRNTYFTPIVAPDQSFVIFEEDDGVVQKWFPDGRTEILPLPSYSIGIISPNNLYIALCNDEDLVAIYDLQSYNVVVSDQSAEGYMWPGDISWNPMSDNIVYSDPYRNQSNSLFLRVVFLDGQTESYENLFSPAFSPDGLYMTALQKNGAEREFVIVDLLTGIRTPIQIPSTRFQKFSPIYWLDFDNGE